MKGLSTVFARNCVIRRIDKASAAAFLKCNHRMGDAACRFRYGMFVKRSTGAAETVLSPGTMVAVAEFSSGRTMRDGRRSFEWIRYASLRGFRVQGGMGKMLKYFLEEQHPDDVMTYSDPGSEDGGKVYRTLGFRSEGTVKKASFESEKFRFTNN